MSEHTDEMALTVATPGQWDREQRELIKRQIAPGISDGDLMLFGLICQRTGLDPFARQIYAIMRNAKDEDGKWTKRMTVQTGIDGYRLLAARTGQLAGIDDAEYDTEEAEHPNKARVTVWRLVSGQRVPFTATARWNEYVQVNKDGQPTSMWAKMPWLMLGKCAEALALRKAFPAELSGIYTSEEMEQADTPEIVPAPAQQAAQPRKRKWGSLRLRARGIGVETEEQWADFVCQVTGKNDSKTLDPVRDYDLVEQAIAAIEQQQAAQQSA